MFSHYNFFVGNLVNNTFSNSKLNVFIDSGFICSNKYVKQVLLLNHSWIPSMLQRGWGLEFCLLSEKWGRLYFSPKKGEVGKIIENGC